MKSDLRDQVEKSCERWGYWAFDNHWKIIAGTLLCTLLLGLGAFQLRIEVSAESFLAHDDVERRVYDAYRREFKSDEGLLLLLHSEDLFSLPFLEKLRDLHHELEENTPHAEDITSLINARTTIGRGNELIVEDLFENWPESEADLERIKARATSNPLYRNTYLSEDTTYTAIRIMVAPGSSVASGDDELVAGFDEDMASGEDAGDEKSFRILNNEETIELIDFLDETVERYAGDDFPIWVSGGPPTGNSIFQSSRRDFVNFSGYAILVIAFFLMLIFKRTSGIFIPLATVVLPLVCTVGVMGYINVPITPVTQILPPFLLVVGVGDAVHIMSVFFQQYDKGKNKRDALAYALGHSGLAVLMTSLTTAGSLLSFLFADLVPIKSFGVAAPLGVLFALAFSLILLPALIAIFPTKRKVFKEEDPEHDGFNRILVAMGDFSTKRPFVVIGIWGCLLLYAFYNVADLRLSHDPIRWLSKKDPVRIASVISDEVFQGSLNMEVIIDTGEENGLYNPSVIKKIERMSLYAESLNVNHVTAGKAISIVDILKETHQALNENNAEFYKVPDRREVIAQELLLFENAGSDDLEDFTESTLQKARLTLLVPFEDSHNYAKYKALLEEKYTEIIDGEFDFYITGNMPLSVRTFGAMFTSIVKSYTIAFILIVPMMIFLIGDLKIGLLSMIPNLTPIILALGMMQLFNLPLDMLMILVGSLAIGIAVDNTIHFMHNFRRYYRQKQDIELAVHNTLVTTGRALFITSIVLAAGFFLYMGASMESIKNFGFITGVTVILAFLADVTLSPALVCIAMRGRR